MEELEFATEVAQSTMPLWLNIAIAIAGTFGGLELIKWLFSLRANRRKDTAQADQEEKTAEQQAADLRRHELDTAYQMLEQVKAQNQYLGEQIKAYHEDKAQDRELKESMRRELAELKMAQVEQERKMLGLQKAFTESETRRKNAERFYCVVEHCPQRRPPIGTYSTDAEMAIIARDSHGRFTKKSAQKAN